MNRRVLVPVVLLGAAALGVLVWWALQAPEETPPEVVETAAPTTEEKSREQERREAHLDAFPFGQFQNDIAALKLTDGPEYKSEEAIAVENWEKLQDVRVSLRLESPTFTQAIEELDRQVRAAGGEVRIYTLPPYFPDEFPIGDLVLTDASVDQVIELLKRRTQETAGAYMTSLGLVIGQEGAVQQAQLDARAARAQLQSRQDAKEEILQKTYRPDLQKASMGQIVRSIHAQTGVEVVVEADVWVTPKVLTWRAQPMTLGAALDHVCKEFGAYSRVKDGRVFLLKP